MDSLYVSGTPETYEGPTDVQGNHSLFGDTKEVSETQGLCKGTTGVSGALQKYQGL